MKLHCLFKHSLFSFMNVINTKEFTFHVRFLYTYINWFHVHGHGVKVPSTSSLSVYTKVLAHNLNDIRNWASLIGLLLRICWYLLSVFLIYCSDEWKKLVNLIYCFQVLFRMNFKIMYFLMKILGNTPSADSAASRDSLSPQNATWGIVFYPHFINDTLNTRAECVRDSLICRKYMFLAKIFALRSMGIQLVPSPYTEIRKCAFLCPFQAIA